jgi:hypothetical protein
MDECDDDDGLECVTAELAEEHREADFGKHDVGKFCPGASAVHGRYQAQDGLARGGQDVLLVFTPPRPQLPPSTLSAFVHSQIVPTSQHKLQAGCARLRLVSVCTHSPPRCSVGGAGAGHTCAFAKEKTHDIMCTAAVMDLLCAPRWSRTTTRAPIGSRSSHLAVECTVHTRSLSRRCVPMWLSCSLLRTKGSGKILPFTITMRMAWLDQSITLPRPVCSCPSRVQIGAFLRVLTHKACVSPFNRCECGRSANQPFCDGSHKGTPFKPKKFVAEKTEERALCL